jgi:hypothetical protein
MTNQPTETINYLWKPATVVHDAANPWSDDELERKPFASIISKLLLSTRRSFVISIDGSYGSGKTFFVRRLCQQLLNDGCACVFVNAWETDFSGDPFTALVSEITEQLAGLGLVDAPSSKKSVARRAGKYLIQRALPGAVRMGTAGIVDIAEMAKIIDVSDDTQEELADIAAKIAEDRLEGFLEAKKSIADFKKIGSKRLLQERGQEIHIVESKTKEREALGNALEKDRDIGEMFFFDIAKKAFN